MRDELSTYLIAMSRIDASGGPGACHPWIGARFNDGYGRLYLAHGVSVLAHRWLLGYLRSEPLKPEEFACHHCDNKPCCNPRHLYVGDAHSNMRDLQMRGNPVNVLSTRNAAKTHCIHGHEFTPANTYIRRGGKGYRECRECVRIRRRRYAIRKAVAA